MQAQAPRNSKITADHLRKHAYLYVRQSTLRQVVENTESGKRQYALRDRAVALGWARDRVTIIDGDQGQSGASADAREGFQQLVSEVGMGRAGIVMGLEVSRLARNNADWHRLLEICGLTHTLILDEDGVYDPTHFNDRLLLGLKGTMSEAELHVLRARLRGGLLNKARRGELKMRLPTGFVYDSSGQVILDPDKEVQESFRLFFRTFARIGSANGVVGHWRKQGLRFPRRLYTGPHKGELVWDALQNTRTRNILRNPRYAGAFAYGRRREVRTASGKVRQAERNRDEWISLFPNAHDGYITWVQYEENLARLSDNAQARGAHRRAPPREGPALLQGLVLCGLCGRRMTVRYRLQKRGLVPDYVCSAQKRSQAAPICQSIPGADIDVAIGRLLLEVITPVALEVSLAVQQELQERLEETDRLRYLQVERAAHDANLARQRYMQVNPANRMVADVLEAAWNDKLRTVTKAREDYERQRQADRGTPSEEQRSRILDLARDFPAVWNSPATEHRDRKRIARLLLEDVTLLKGDEVAVHVRFRGGVSRSLTLARPKAAWETWVTPEEVVIRIDELLDHHTYREVATILNDEGHVSGQGRSFQADRVKKIRRAYGQRRRIERLREQGLISLEEVAERLGCSTHAVKARRRRGTLQVRAVRLDDTGACMYQDPARLESPPPGAHHNPSRRGAV